MNRTTRSMLALRRHRGLTLPQAMIVLLACMLLVAAWVRAMDMTDDARALLRDSDFVRLCRKCEVSRTQFERRKADWERQAAAAPDLEVFIEQSMQHFEIDSTATH